VHSATLDEGRISAAWRARPGALVAVALGPAGLVIIDCDRHDPNRDGVESLLELEAVHGELPEGPLAFTAGGGGHHYFRAPGGVEELPALVTLAPGVELLSGARYVVAPPSRRPDGRMWTWAAGQSPDEVDLPKLPAWVVELARATRATPSGGAGRPEARPRDEWVVLARTGATHGSRHDSLLRLAGHVLRRPRTAVLRELLLAWSEVRCRPPLDRAEGERIVDDLIAKELARFRRGAP
jgi:hypothetical protein